MNTCCIKLAGYAVEVNTLYANFQNYCNEFVSEERADLVLWSSSEDIAYERIKQEHEDMLKGVPLRDLTDEYLETIAIQRKIAEEFFNYNILLFHGSVVEVDGAAYLFTAKSGTGKSTHTRLWRKLFGKNASMINDDKPFLKFEGEQIIACGSPWNGKHRLGSNSCAPLKAICILERDDKNSIIPISPKEVLHMLFQQSNRPRNPELMPKYMELIDRLTKSVEFYRLRCNMDLQAAMLSYETMSGRKWSDVK